MEFPKYIQLDFLLVLLGVIISGATGYFFYIKNIYNAVLLVAFLFGIMIFFLGFLEMFDNYFSDKKIRMLNNKITFGQLSKKYKKIKPKN